MLSAGAILLAVGALLGWLVAINVDRPELLARMGVRHAHRVLQVHLDYLMMGLILLAVGTAFPRLPTWVTTFIMIGAVTNPLLFVPLAFRQEFSQRPWYKVLAFISFGLVSIGLLAVATNVSVG